MLVREWLDRAQLENDGLNSNNIKEEWSKIQKKHLKYIYIIYLFLEF